jgi:hypothetical protein
MSTFNGTPSQFFFAMLNGGIDAERATSIGIGQTAYDKYTASSARFSITVCHGNSLTLDYADILNASLRANQASHPQQVWTAWNKGTGVISTPALAAEFMTVVQRHYTPQRTCLLQFQELGNHIQNLGASFTTARDAAISYCATARSLGWKLAFHIPTPRAQDTDPGYSGSASAWDPGKKAIFDQTCDYFRSHPEHYDFLLDLAAVPELSDPFNLTYYDPDGCHFTATGINIKAAAVAAANAAWVFS